MPWLMEKLLRVCKLYCVLGEVNKVLKAKTVEKGKHRAVVSDLVLLVDVDPLGDEVLDDVLVSLPGSPVDGRVATVVHHPQVAAFLGQDL